MYIVMLILDIIAGAICATEKAWYFFIIYPAMFLVAGSFIGTSTVQSIALGRGVQFGHILGVGIIILVCRINEFNTISLIVSGIWLVLNIIFSLIVAKNDLI